MEDPRRLAKSLKSLRDTYKDEVEDLTARQLEILLQVYIRDGIGQTTLTKMIDLLSGTVSKNIAVMSRGFKKDKEGRVREVGSGLLRVEEDQFDRRNKNIYLTEKGKEFVSLLLGGHNESLKESTKN